MEMAAEIVLEQTFGGRLHDRNHALAVYRTYAEEVRRTIAPDRLLTYDVSEGWGPLCAFLEVPVPGHPLPAHQHERRVPQGPAAGLRQVTPRAEPRDRRYSRAAKNTAAAPASSNRSHWSGDSDRNAPSR